MNLLRLSCGNSSTSVSRAFPGDSNSVRWTVQLATWWDDQEICVEWPSLGVRAFDDHVRQIQGGEIEYIESLPHGGEQFRGLVPVVLAQLFDDLRG